MNTRPLFLYRVHLARYRNSGRSYTLPAYSRADAIERAHTDNPGYYVTRCDCESNPPLALIR